MLTIPHHAFTPYLPATCSWIRGQLELAESGFLHWQVLVAFRSKTSIIGTRDAFGPHHAELSRSEAASAYVWKELTRVAGTQFELGSKPIRRNSAVDWESVWESAKAGDLTTVPPHVRVVSYRTLRAIGADHARPRGMDRTIEVFWGLSGSGKSHMAWELAGPNGYAKDPRTKWWNGYQNQTHVVIDEFRGGIDVSHILRWFDKYPVHVETKGSSCPLEATHLYITSNLDPRVWYPDLDSETLTALMRRMKVTHFLEKYNA